MDIQKLNKSGRLGEWAQIISQCRNSGMTVAAWCREYGISTKTYYYRLRRLCEAIPEPTTQDSLPLPTGEMEPLFAGLLRQNGQKGVLLLSLCGWAVLKLKS